MASLFACTASETVAMLLTTLSFWVAGAAEATRNSDEKVTRVFKNRIVEKAIGTEQSDWSRDIVGRRSSGEAK
jgi:hypothetical protein